MIGTCHRDQEIAMASKRARYQREYRARIQHMRDLLADHSSDDESPCVPPRLSRLVSNDAKDADASVQMTVNADKSPDGDQVVSMREIRTIGRRKIYGPLRENLMCNNSSRSSEDSYSAGGASSAKETEPGSDQDYGYNATPISSDEQFIGYGGSESDDLSSDNDTSDVTRQKLASWLVKSNIARSLANELLQIMTKAGVKNLPADQRTLLKTPRSISQIVEKSGGRYKYFGIANCLRTLLERNTTFAENNHTLDIDINIDGIPLFKSTSGQFWPILGRVSHFPPFIVALFYGTSKPEDVNTFLEDFMDEYNHLKEYNFQSSGQTFDIQLRSIIADAPARCFVKKIKGHTGFFACERCTVKGEHHHNRIVFNGDEVHTKRTDEDFARLLYHSVPNDNTEDNHQKGISPFIQLGFHCVTRVPLDYMHAVCLGVFKRFLTFLKQGPRSGCRLSSNQLNQISNRLYGLRGQLPREFARSPRKLDELDRWKATEFRTCLLYLGYVAFADIVPANVYSIYKKLSVAISILLHPNENHRSRFVEFARELLLEFIKESEAVFGRTFVVYNVHILQHLPDDVISFNSSLNELCSFPFENFLQTLKRYVHNSRNPIVQVCKRLKETEHSRFVKSYKQMKTYISSVPKDSVFYLEEDKSFAMIQRKSSKDNYYHALLLQLDQTENLFNSPCPSKLLNICLVKNLDNQPTEHKLINSKAFTRKVVIIPMLNNIDFVFIPMLHEIEVSVYR